MKIKTAPDWEIDTTVSSTNLLNPPYIYPIRQKSNTCVINGGRVTTLSVERNADVAQGEIVHAYLVERRAELCEILDEQAVKMERYQRISASTGVLRDRRVFARVNR